MINRTDKEMVNAYEEIISTLADHGLKPKLQRLDNEASRAPKRFLTSQEFAFQLAQHHMHRCNAVEWAIQTFKNHFMSGLC